MKKSGGIELERHPLLEIELPDNLLVPNEVAYRMTQRRLRTVVPPVRLLLHVQPNHSCIDYSCT